MAVDVLLLAAGFGKRLRPLTDEIPKPLLPVCGVPLIEWRLDQLLAPSDSSVAADIGSLVINSHHLSGAIDDYLDNHPAAPRITRLHEPEILGTGGAIVNARDHIATDPFLLINGDTISDLPVIEAVHWHRSHKFTATMVLSRSALHRNVVVAGNRVARIITTGTSADAFTFTGTHVISRDLIERLPHAGFHDIRDTYLTLAAEGRLGAFVLPGNPILLDIGTPLRYLDAHRICLRHYRNYLKHHSRFPLRKNELLADRYRYIAPDVTISTGAFIRNSVILSGGKAGPESRIESSIIGPGVEINCPVRNTLVTKTGQVTFAVEAG